MSWMMIYNEDDGMTKIPIIRSLSCQRTGSHLSTGIRNFFTTRRVSRSTVIEKNDWIIVPICFYLKDDVSIPDVGFKFCIGECRCRNL